MRAIANKMVADQKERDASVLVLLEVRLNANFQALMIPSYTPTERLLTYYVLDVCFGINGKYSQATKLVNMSSLMSHDS
ncbi:Uncharacterized protein TCM_034137 [Theobroma cacao]|uniref:Uncharacterized protein n=1 Tax=Theobroma cacao TaxID=3641 RepID=A0A061FDA0_THECC|nr:Uncharacterized protein TCM_034137 [Theobroma cacao]